MTNLLAQPAWAAETAGAYENFSVFLPFAAVIAVIYFLFIRPQNRRLRLHREMVAGLKRGDMVVTSGGIIGKIQRVQEDECLVEVADGVRLRVLRGTISDVLNSAEKKE